MAAAQQTRSLPLETWLALLLAVIFLSSAMRAQSGASQSQAQQAAQSQADQDIPDAPSVVQPPAPKPVLPPASSIPKSGQAEEAPGQSSSRPTSSQAAPQSNQAPGPSGQAGQPPPPMPPVKTVSPGSIPRNQLNPKENLYTIRQLVNFVLIPVMVKDREGRRVDGLLSSDFMVLENGKKQQLTFFTSDPFQLSVAIVIDLGMPDVVLQKLDQTFPALVGAFSPYDEYAVYTYSSTVSQVMDFTRRSERLTATLDQIKMVRGGSNGPPVLNDPFSVGPTVNGVPVGGPPIEPVQTPRRESHVLNDAILRAGVDLAKRERSRRKVILIISNGREMGSQASYRDVLRMLESRDIQVKAIVLDTGALPFYKQAEHFRIKTQGYGDILPKYTAATGGGQIMTELTRNSIEQAFSEITSEARNQYTLGYPTQATVSATCRSLEVIVDKRNLKISAKDKYCPAPAPR
jgi:VWFA-related protein